MSILIGEITLFIAIAIVVLGSSWAYPMVQPTSAQNMIGNQSGNQTTRIDLLPPRVLEEEENLTEMLGEQ
jgi:hypothetical protein